MRPLGMMIAALLCCGGAQAADRGFKEIVQAISDEYGTRPTHIPLFGLVKAVTGVERQAGAKNLDVAIFEDLPAPRTGRDLAVRLKEIAGHAWKPFVDVRSRKSGDEETTLVFLRADGKDIELLVATIERTEATVVKLSLNEKGLRRWLSDPAGAAEDQRGDGDRDQ